MSVIPRTQSPTKGKLRRAILDLVSRHEAAKAKGAASATDADLLAALRTIVGADQSPPQVEHRSDRRDCMARVFADFDF